MRNLNTDDCDCDKTCGFSEYLGINICSCKERILINYC